MQWCGAVARRYARGRSIEPAAGHVDGAGKHRGVAGVCMSGCARGWVRNAVVWSCGAAVHARAELWCGDERSGKAAVRRCARGAELWCSGDVRSGKAAVQRCARGAEL
jgi:hypothetical protein